MKKILFLLTALLFVFIPTMTVGSVCASTYDKLVVISDFVYIYEDENFTTHYDFKVNNNELLTLKNENEGSFEVEYTLDETQYLGFVSKEGVTFYTPSRETIPSFNAKILNDCIAYDIDDNPILLKKGQDVYVYEKFDSNAKFTNIKFINENQVTLAKVNTKNIKLNGVNKALIIALSIIIAVVGIISIMFGFKKSWHKKLKNEKT